jgi:hypothetical protein
MCTCNIRALLYSHQLIKIAAAAQYFILMLLKWQVNSREGLSYLIIIPRRPKEVYFAFPSNAVNEIFVFFRLQPAAQAAKSTFHNRKSLCFVLMKKWCGPKLIFGSVSDQLHRNYSRRMHSYYTTAVLMLVGASHHAHIYIINVRQNQSVFAWR